MIERIVFVAVSMTIGVVIYHLFTRRQVQRATASAPTDPLLNGLQPGIPTIVYFTTPTCTPCRLRQTPMLQRLQQEMGDGLRVIRVDATEQPEAADRWGVFSVPTTFVLDKNGQPRNVHNGVVDVQTLKRELEMEI
jgi:thioredoxin 1